MARGYTWLTTEEAASRIGMSPSWVRRQIVERRLFATAWQVGGRRTYRIRSDDWAEFVRRYSQRTSDPDWE